MVNKSDLLRKKLGSPTIKLANCKNCKIVLNISQEIFIRRKEKKENHVRRKKQIRTPLSVVYLRICSIVFVL